MYSKSIDSVTKSFKTELLSNYGLNRDAFTEVNTKSSLELSNLPAYENVLLLQGPVGPFFSKLARFLKQRGSKTHKINFNPGDEYFYPPKESNTHLYDFTLEYWPQYLERYIVQHQIEAVFLFGDCRPIHFPAKEICKQYGIDLWVFEEGYFRPHYFTMDYFGVNANSRLFRSESEFIIDYGNEIIAKQNDREITRYEWSHLHITRHAIVYWLVNVLQPFKCANYDHHRELNLVIAYRWIKNFFAHWFYKIKDWSKIKKLLQHQPSEQNNYFIFPLQVHDDAQMIHHSDFKSVEDAIEMVITSFYKHLSLHKNLATKLIIKHHPMDRGHKNYSEFIKNLSKTLGIKNHIYYLHELDLDLILPYCKGCVTVNSTLGLKALGSGVPVKNLGRSFYDKKNITSRKSLQQFWKNPGIVSAKNIQAFRQFVISQTQVNGCLYSPKYQPK
ncbi:capsular biosynthesis protein [Polynucleobacter sp. JS-JIR-II-c23]|uniref:capsular biosynthesis protein n=1 Tax=Polynucleobacter sp. JS-JIR-II-c23 TaxID=1758393 RepID=UPI002B22A35D|nr:capsular biosynthesis protein [Polynucleobacter sp. JS-JIR-II-c23]MEA9603797.1 capsular biosynthesis protein [Polynucleobacter sp. JS-JIR-II-c23]